MGDAADTVVGEKAHITVAHDVYLRLRDDILNGRCAPAAPLKFDALREKYKVGVSPLREALSSLANERLVTLSGFKGYRVAAFTLEELKDIAANRRMLESEALTSAIDNGGDDWEASIVAALHRLQLCKVQGANSAAFDEWERRHADFHSALLAGCTSHWLLHMTQLLSAHHQRYRRSIWDYSTRSPRLSRKFGEQHAELAQLAIKRKSKAAVALLKAHYDDSANALIEEFAARRAAGQV